MSSSLRRMSNLLVILLLSYSGLISGDEDTITMFFKGYDKAIRPNFDEDKPTAIRASIYVESFGNIEEANMEYKVYTYFRQYWTDSRLVGRLNHTIVIKGSDIDNIWTPDPYCYNARESNLMMPHEEINSYVRIEPNGEVGSSIGVTLLASCVMNLRHFPLDSQTCHLKFGSYAYSTKDIIYEWTPDEVAVGNKEMAQFEYKGAKLTSATDVFTVGNFSTITATFSFQRRIGYFLIQVYLPDIFVVLLSWIVFFMEKDDIGNRMALGITTILTIMFLLGSLNGNLPKVSYPKALDWYLLVSFSFVFLSLIECMIVYVFMKKATKDHDKITLKSDGIPLSKRISSSVKSLIGSRTDVNSPTSDSIPNGSVTGGDDDLEMVNRATKAGRTVVDDGAKEESIKDERMERIASAIDKVSRFLFPFAFVSYNIFYWAYY